jgi:uncharacterized membrane protein YqjE
MATRPSSPITSAIQDVTEGLTGMVRHHLQLARHEARADAAAFTRQLGILLAAASVVGLGYLMLLVGVILLVGAYYSYLGMAICALSMSVVHLIGGVVALIIIRRRLKHSHKLVKSNEQIERSREWVKQLPMQEH